MRPKLDLAMLHHRNRDRSTLACSNGIVCASQPLAAMAGVDMLKAGGSCVDAAICANAMLGLTEPSMNGIGGDLFAIVWSESDRRLYGLNASGRSPYAWSIDEAHRRGVDSIPGQSALAWTVPGCVSGWSKLSERFGKLGLKRCLEPAIEYAEAGFPLSPIIAQDFALVAEGHSTLAETYARDGLPEFGSVFRNPALARSYRLIAESGPDAMYKGDIAERIVAKSAELGGLMSLRDLAEHEAEWVQPVSTSYRGYDVWELPPNGQGIAALQILNLLEHFDIGSLEQNSAAHLHLFIEAKKLAFEDRGRFYADASFARVPVAWLISKDYAAERVKLIDGGRAAARVLPGEAVFDSDTVYLTAADREGNMISLIQSIYGAFGSTICPDGVGFAMQNRGLGFSLDPRHPNRLEPHKRPFHTIIPAFVTHAGEPVLSFGVMGGDFQPQGHAQVLMNMLDFGMSPQQAGDQARVAHDGGSSPWGTTAQWPGTVLLEHGIGPDAAADLREMGHEVQSNCAALGGYQAIWRSAEPRVYFGGSDPRKDGGAYGF